MCFIAQKQQDGSLHMHGLPMPRVRMAKLQIAQIIPSAIAQQ